MSLKFEIIGNNLVVTDTDSSVVKLERPVSDIFGVCEDSQWKIFTRTQRNDILLSGGYAALVDSSGSSLTKSTLASFFRIKLGFNKAGSSALQTNSNIGTWLAQSTVSMSAFQSVFGGVSKTEDGFGTAHLIMECPAHFEAVRLIFANGNNATDIFIEGIKVVVADSFGDLAMDAAFIAQDQYVTIDGNQRGMVSRRVDAITGNGPNLKLTDWFPIDSLDRSDVIGGDPIIATRVVFDGRQAEHPTGPSRNSANGASYWIRGGSEWNTGGAAFKLYTSRPWGNFLNAALSGSFSAPALATADNQAASYCPIFGIQFKCKGKVITLMNVGDSNDAGDFASSSDRSFPWIAAAAKAVSTLDRPVFYCNAGLAAQTSTTFTKYGVFAANLLNPTHIIHKGFTPNDATIGSGTPTAYQQQLDGMTANIVLMKTCADSIGAKFYLSNGIPRNAAGSDTVSYWDATNGLLTEKYRQALLYKYGPGLDTNSAVANKTAVPYRFQSVALGDPADLFLTDRVHANQAGRALMRVPAIAFITKIRDVSLPV